MKENKKKQSKTEEIKVTEKVENKEQDKKEEAKVNENKKQNKVRKTIVTIVLILAAIILYIIERGQYLEIKEIGENYLPIFWQNLRNISITAILNFIIVFTVIYISTSKIKDGLKTFFEDEKKAMPKLPQKSIAFIIATIITIATSGYILQKALPCFYNTQFVATDPVFGLDIGYFVFIWPFLELITMYALIAIIAATVYMAIYYLIVFNVYFDGISRESVKKSNIEKQALSNLKKIIVLFAILILLLTQNIGVQKFIVLSDEQTENYSIFGAGITETTIRLWGYVGLSIIMVLSVFKAIKEFTKGNTKKIIKALLWVPAYLVILAVGMLGFNLIYVNSNELDKERTYIAENIKNTKKAYGIDIEEDVIKDEGTITQSAITANSETISNIPIVNAENVIKDLEGSQTTKGYYKFTRAQIGNYTIDDKQQLVYVTPREIASAKATYNNKTYEYTHGFGAIITSATSTTSSGNINHIQKSFEQTDEVVNVSEPRIYFGLETNSTVVTNSNNKKEFDYPTENALSNTENTYDGPAGLKANFLDRLVLSLREKDVNLLFSGNVKSDSKIITNRNIIQRAKTVMPYLEYDQNPYLVIRNNGELVWVLDAYTTSNNYPYSQRTMLENNGITKKEINYIRNSVKVIINAYTGEVTFYRTDKTDPIAMVYEKTYPDLFAKEEIPEDISNHFVYPEYLYSIQAEVLERYHNIQPDILYRSDDIWDVATHNTSSKMTSTKGTAIKPYYTMLKTSDSNSSRLGLVLPYTPYGKQNIKAYLVGSCDENGNNVLKLYNYTEDSNVLGPMQLDTQLSQDERISKEIDSLNVTGTKISKDIIIVPIDNTLLYVEPIYQQYVNETDSLPVLKKVVVASGTKVAIGDTFTQALTNLVSQYAVNIEVGNSDNIDELVSLIIKANNNLKTSTQSSDWEQIGKDTKKLQTLIDRLEEVKAELDKKEQEEQEKISENINEIINSVE
ncbi:MAG: UPF0182 family protein [Clostridium sp.]|nr:UPF0182 family protein [Clostridium sp.]